MKKLMAGCSETVMNFKKLIGLTSLVGLTLIMIDCGNNNSPSNPSNGGGGNNSPTSTFTPTATPVLSIQGFFVERTYSNSSLSYQTYAWLQLGGQPVTTAAVTLSCSGLGISGPVPYSGPATSGSVYSLYSSTAAFSYVPGQTYVLSAAVAGQTSSVTMIAPGGNITPYKDTDGAVTQFTDNVAGNTNLVVIRCTAPSTLTYTANGSGTSFNVPDSGVSDAYSAPGTLYLAAFLTENSYGTGPFSLAIADQSDIPITVTDTIWSLPAVFYGYDTVTGPSYFFQVGLSVQGTAPTGAGVTLSDITAAHSVAIPYSNTYVSGGVSYANYVYTGTGLSYAPGDTYKLSTATAAGTASATLVAPGAVTAVLQDTTTNAITLLGWQNAGSTYNNVYVNEISPSPVTHLFSNVTSPMGFSNSFYTGGHNSVYRADVDVDSATSSITNGVLSNGTTFNIEESYTQSITIN